MDEKSNSFKIFKMNTSNKIHLTIISLTNLILISFMIQTAWQGNDKAILVIILLYPLLTLLNAIVWFILFILKRSESKFYKWNTIGLIILLIPALAIASIY